MSPQSPPIRRPTAHDVARLAGVSQAAVSRSYTPGASISEATRRRVLEAAEELGYRPNLVARSLIKSRSTLVGVVIPHLDNPFYATLLELLTEQLARAGYRPLLFTTPMSAFADPVLDEVLNFNLEGLILVSSSISSELGAQCRRFGLPVVQVNRVSGEDEVASVVGANAEGAAQIARFLIAGGHQRFAFMAGLEASSTNIQREGGFRRGLAEGGRELAHRVVANYSFEQALEAARVLLSAPDRPDALFCANDNMAIAALSVARSEFGLEPGRDISIIGFDDFRLAALPEFALTTYRQPAPEMAAAAVEMLGRLTTDPQGSVTPVKLPGALILRGSARLPDSGLSHQEHTTIWVG